MSEPYIHGQERNGMSTETCPKIRDLGFRGLVLTCTRPAGHTGKHHDRDDNLGRLTEWWGDPQRVSPGALAVDDRVRFAEEKRPYTVQAVSEDGRWAVCTKPFAARRMVLYSLVDLASELRGVDDSIGNSLGYETREDCEEALALVVTGEFGFSHRRRPIPLYIAKVVRAES